MHDSFIALVKILSLSLSFFFSLSLSLSPPPSPSYTHTCTQTPILFYSAHDPHRAYTKSIKPVREGESPIEVPLILELQWVLSASAVNRPQLLDMLHTAVGIDQIVYLYAKVRYAVQFMFTIWPEIFEGVNFRG